MLEHDVVGRVLRRADLLHDHVLLALELVGLEGRIGEDVGQDIERQRHVGLEHAGDNRPSISDDVAALMSPPTASISSAIWRALRVVVPLNAMCSSRCEMPCSLTCSSRPAGAGPDAHRRRFEMRHRVGDDGQARRQLGEVHAHATTPSRAAREAARTNVSTSAWLAGITVNRSGRVIRSPSQAGNSGRAPQAASTASGNFAGCAVDSMTIGTGGLAVPFPRRRRPPRYAGRSAGRPRA